VEHADVDGVQLEYKVTGAGEPVLLIHGAFVADSFRPFLAEPKLVDAYQLITYRRRGYGGSGGTITRSPVSAERQAADCAGVLRWLGLQRAHIVGHSFGGCVALQLALDAPQLVRTLALLEPALFVGASAQSYRESLLRSTERYRIEGAGVVMEEFLHARWPAYSRAALEQVLPGGFEQALRDAPTTFEMDIGLTDWTFGEDEARRITQPALVVLGGGSPALHPRFEETYRLLLDWLPDARGFVLPGATHLLQIESPHASAALATALGEFFAASG